MASIYMRPKWVIQGFDFFANFLIFEVYFKNIALDGFNCGCMSILWLSIHDSIASFVFKKIGQLKKSHLKSLDLHCIGLTSPTWPTYTVALIRIGFDAPSSDAIGIMIVMDSGTQEFIA